MPQEVLHKIQYLCRAIPKVEWSGILLYKMEGTIKDPQNCVAVLKDIIPMDKGTKTYTGYSFNETKREASEDKMIDYFALNPVALEEDWKIGMIHSHNSMPVFFSQTDVEELEDNANSHNFYLSLIVNNWMEFMAKIATVATAKTRQEVQFKALDEEGKEYVISETFEEVEDKKLITYDCVIEHPTLDIQVSDELFKKNLQDILKEERTTVSRGNYWKPERSRGVKSSVPSYGGYFGMSEFEDFAPSNSQTRGNIPNIEDVVEHILPRMTASSIPEIHIKFISYVLFGIVNNVRIELLERSFDALNFRMSPLKFKEQVFARLERGLDKYFPKRHHKSSEDREDALAYLADVLEDNSFRNETHILPVSEELFNTIFDYE